MTVLEFFGKHFPNVHLKSTYEKNIPDVHTHIHTLAHTNRQTKKQKNKYTIKLTLAPIQRTHTQKGMGKSVMQIKFTVLWNVQ